MRPTGSNSFRDNRRSQGDSLNRSTNYRNSAEVRNLTILPSLSTHFSSQIRPQKQEQSSLPFIKVILQAQLLSSEIATVETPLIFHFVTSFQITQKLESSIQPKHRQVRVQTHSNPNLRQIIPFPRRTTTSVNLEVWSPPFAPSTLLTILASAGTAPSAREHPGKRYFLEKLF